MNKQKSYYKAAKYCMKALAKSNPVDDDFDEDEEFDEEMFEKALESLAGGMNTLANGSSQTLDEGKALELIDGKYHAVVKAFNYICENEDHLEVLLKSIDSEEVELASNNIFDDHIVVSNEDNQFFALEYNETEDEVVFSKPYKVEQKFVKATDTLQVKKK